LGGLSIGSAAGITGHPDAKAIDPATQSGSRLRKTAVEVSQGMIRQNLLTLTKLKKQGLIHDGDELLIEAQPSGERFRTDFMFDGNKVRERGAIARFYRDAASVMEISSS
jgi:hypothetical protein